jgi:Na+-driven multidrug efflux pump
MQISVAMTVGLLAVYLSLVLTFRNSLSLMFLSHSASDSSEVQTLRKCILLVAAGSVGDWLNTTLAGALKGAGHQQRGAWLYGVTHWGLGAALLYQFVFRFNWGVIGIWVALAIVANVQCVCMVVRSCNLFVAGLVLSYYYMS